MALPPMPPANDTRPVDPSEPMQPEGQETHPIEFDVHIKSSEDELQAAIGVLQEAGLTDIADTLQQAMQPADMDDANSPDALAGEMEAMGNNPHGD